LRGSGYRFPIGLERTLKPSGQPRVGVDLSRRSPFPDELAQFNEGVDVGCSRHDLGEVIGESTPFPLREEFQPGEGIGEGALEGLWTVDGKVS
jgi:hypothetical protein